MYKETIICIFVTILIIIGDIITGNYTKSSVKETSNILSELREEITKDIVNNEIAKEKMNQVNEEWNKRHEKLAFYIEHDELEKVENDFTSLKSFMETEEYNDAISELDKSVFILKHIEEKNKFRLENIF